MQLPTITNRLENLDNFSTVRNIWSRSVALVKARIDEILALVYAAVSQNCQTNN